MGDFVKGSSSYVRLEAHASFNVKYRHKVFDIPRFRERCAQIFAEVAEGRGIAIMETGFDRDHVHLILMLRCHQSLSQIAKDLKGESGRRLLTEFPHVKRKCFRGSGLWAPTKYADSLGRSPEELRDYMRRQGEKRPAAPSCTLNRFFGSNTAGDRSPQCNW